MFVCCLLVELFYFLLIILGIPVLQQCLAFKGKETVIESNLVGGSIIDLLSRIQVFVKTPQNKKLVFGVFLCIFYLCICIFIFIFFL
jgi:hypothetical protein